MGTVVMAVPYSFFEVFVGGTPEDLPSGRTQARGRHLNTHEDRHDLEQHTGHDAKGV